MRVDQLMTKPAMTCHVNDPLSVAAELMWNHDCGSIAVVRDDGHLAGIVTDRDICMAAYTQGLPIASILANTAMSKTTTTVRPDQEVLDAERLMAEKHVHRLPVVDEAGLPIGVISISDIAREVMRTETPVKDAVQETMETLAAICGPHVKSQQAA